MSISLVKPIKILYISKDRHPTDIRTAKITESFQIEGFDVTILCRWHSEDTLDTYKDIKLVRAGAGLHLLSQPIPYNPIWRRKIKKTIEKFKPNLIIVREIMLAIDAAHFAKKYDIPIIMDMAENYPVVMRGWNKYKKNFFIRLLVHKLMIPDKIEKIAVSKMDGILTVCEEQNERLIKQYSYPKEKLQIVHNTPLKMWFKDVKCGILLNPRVFAYHGLINSERNLENLLYAFDLAWVQNNQIKLIIAGYGELEESLKELAKTLDSHNSITFKGKFAHGNIKNLYSEMDFGVLPYRIDEHINQTISNKYFDYMGAGKPMITSLAVPMIRLNKETSAGIAVDCDDIEELSKAMLKFVEFDNFNEVQRMSLAAQNEFRIHYSWDRDFARLLKFIRNNYI